MVFVGCGLVYLVLLAWFLERMYYFGSEARLSSALAEARLGKWNSAYRRLATGPAPLHSKVNKSEAYLHFHEILLAKIGSATAGDAPPILAVQDSRNAKNVMHCVDSTTSQSANVDAI